MRDYPQDVKDLLNLCDADLCKECDRYYLRGYICPHCGKDNSNTEDEDN